MTSAEYDRLTGAQKLRLAVRHFDQCSETFLDQYSAAELLRIHRAWLLSGWDIRPDRWHEDQVHDALMGEIPRWDDNERPILLFGQVLRRRGTK